jgi:hypothetical protein
MHPLESMARCRQPSCEFVAPNDTVLDRSGRVALLGLTPCDVDHDREGTTDAALSADSYHPRGHADSAPLFA